MQSIKLTYHNENDKAYGLAGMALSIAALDSSDLITGISIDAEDDSLMVEFSQQYYFGCFPSGTPKTIWQNTLRNFQVTSAMTLANIYARSLVRLQTNIPAKLLEKVHSTIIDEGINTCCLDEDEAEDIYQRMLSYNRRIFGNPRLKPAITAFADIISRRRSLTCNEIEEELRQLQLL